VKLGANNSKKTWVAVGLAVIAVLLTARMIIGNFWSPETTSANTATPAASAPRPAARPAPQRRLHLTPVRRASGATTNASLDPRLRLDLLKETETATYTGDGRNIFKAQAEDVKIQAPIAPAIVAKNPEPVQPAVVVPPPPPPIPLKFFGFASQEGAKSVFLAGNDGDVFIAKEGDIVQRRYKIVKINPTSIEVMDVLSNNQQTIPLTAG
jgi:hypothetical protein